MNDHVVLTPRTSSDYAPVSSAINMTIRPEPWTRDAACQEVVGDFMFPDSSDASGSRKAKQLCDTCPVRQQCLDYAVQNNIRFGIWGGKSTLERDAIRRRSTERGSRAKS